MSAIKISDSEWQVMAVVWNRSPISASEIVTTLGPKTGWQPRTIRTLLDRLVKKKALKMSDDGKRHVYEPRISMKEGVHTESQSFLQRVFGGKSAAMLLHLVGEAKLTKEEIQELKTILTDKENK